MHCVSACVAYVFVFNCVDMTHVAIASAHASGSALRNNHILHPSMATVATLQFWKAAAMLSMVQAVASAVRMTLTPSMESQRQRNTSSSVCGSLCVSVGVRV